MLISIEGIDGAGKTTLAAALAREIGAVALREPGGVEVAERIRALLIDPSLTVDPRAEALLFAAARAQLVEERVRPLLGDGTPVVLDRFTDSTLAYQGAARGLGVEQLRALNEFATGGLIPDVTLLLRLDPAVARGRWDGAPDRFEAEGDDYFATVARVYDELAAAEPGRFRVIDAAQSPQVVLDQAIRYLDCGA